MTAPRNNFYSICRIVATSLLFVVAVIVYLAGPLVREAVEQASQEGITEFAELGVDQKNAIASGSTLLVAAVCICMISFTIFWRTYKVKNVIEPVVEISKKQFSKVFSPFVPTISVTLAFLSAAVATYFLVPNQSPVVLNGFTAYLTENSPTPLGYSLLAALAATVIYIFTSGREPYCELLDEYDKATRQQPADTTAQYSREYSTQEKKNATRRKKRYMPLRKHKDLTLREMHLHLGIIGICVAVLGLALIGNIIAWAARSPFLDLPASVFCIALLISCWFALHQIGRLKEAHAKVRLSAERFARITTWIRLLAFGIAFSVLGFVLSATHQSIYEVLATKAVATLGLGAAYIYAVGPSHAEHSRVMDECYAAKRDRRRKRS